MEMDRQISSRKFSRQIPTDSLTPNKKNRLVFDGFLYISNWVFPKIRVGPKMNGENKGKPYFLMDDLGAPLFSETSLIDLVHYQQHQTPSEALAGMQLESHYISSPKGRISSAT